MHITNYSADVRTVSYSESYLIRVEERIAGAWVTIGEWDTISNDYAHGNARDLAMVRRDARNMALRSPWSGMQPPNPVDTRGIDDACARGYL